jgi:type III secretion protein V
MNIAAKLPPLPKKGGAEIGLVLVVILLLGLFILQVPPWVMDLLIAVNMAMTVLVLFGVLFVKEPLHLATFPSILLLTTLFRLGLNIASTRLILLHANAGEIIRAFGKSVVSGNYVVGAIVFTVITIVQFLVIAKGAERVAEVGARFALDAMPGKQMSIDAELRAGAIDAAEAAKRRSELERASQFYGSMDGAMKFVKGDTIAALVIVLINLIGGLAIGVAQKNMEAGAALKRYGLLSIGDGLVSQLPSIVLALAAGMLVTRVASEQRHTPLGEEVAKQVFGPPKPVYYSAAFIGLLGAVGPLLGLPAVPFLVIAVSLGLYGWTRSKAIARQARRELHERPKVREFKPGSVPLAVAFSEDLEHLIEGTEEGTIAMQELRDRVFADLGVPLPPIRVMVDVSLPPGRVVLHMRELPTYDVDVPEEASDEEVLDLVRQKLEPALLAHAHEFIQLGTVQKLLDQLDQTLVRNVVPKPIPLYVLAAVLRQLVSDGFSIKELDIILEALAQLGGGQVVKDAAGLAGPIRFELRRQTSHRLTKGEPAISVYTLDPMFEEEVRAGVYDDPHRGPILALAPNEAHRLAEAVRNAITTTPPREGMRPVVLVRLEDLRPFVRQLLEPYLPEVIVISPSDILPSLRIDSLMRIAPV